MRNSTKINHPNHTADLYNIIGIKVWCDYGNGTTEGKIMGYNWVSRTFIIIGSDGGQTTCSVCYFNSEPII